jgi:hypothetical protein
MAAFDATIIFTLLLGEAFAGMSGSGGGTSGGGPTDGELRGDSHGSTGPTINGTIGRSGLLDAKCFNSIIRSPCPEEDDEYCSLKVSPGAVYKVTCCAAGQTCCKKPDHTFECCPHENAVCCGGKTCCPEKFTCTKDGCTD